MAAIAAGRQGDCPVAVLPRRRFHCLPVADDWAVSGWELQGDAGVEGHGYIHHRTALLPPEQHGQPPAGAATEAFTQSMGSSTAGMTV